MRYGALTAVLMKTKVFWDISAVYTDKSINIHQFTRGHLRETKSSTTLQFGLRVLCFQNVFYEISYNVLCIGFYCHLPQKISVQLIVKVKVKESRNRPSVAQRVPGCLGSQISMTFTK
jgi:hypothetical protein